MAFSNTIKDNILALSARHCCVCHRYKGVKIEIHHIIPKEQGGQDSFENAIVLCFDCHSDAGHYFAKHPKGTKFSPNELKKHKEKWFDIVKNNKIPISDEQNTIHSKYLITSNFEIIQEILNNEFENFPIKNCLLLETPAYKFLKKALKKQKYRTGEYNSGQTIKQSDYLIKFPDSKIPDTNSFFSNYIHIRIPTIEEINEYYQNDNICNYLISNGISPSEICRIVTNINECGAEEFEELFIIKPIYLELFAVTNISDNQINLNKLDFLFFNGVKYLQEENKGTLKSIEFPKTSILPNQTIIIPIATILSDFQGLEENENTTITNYLSIELTQSISHGEIVANKNQEFLGPSLIPKTIYFENSSLDLHEFDFNNLYWINRDWQCGSCPHLFYENNLGEIIYQNELFSEQPNFYQVETINIPVNICAIIICELEKEITHIESIKLNDKLLDENITLVENTHIKYNVKPYDKIELKGMYKYESEVFRKMTSIAKQKIITKFIKNYKKTYSSNFKI